MAVIGCIMKSLESIVKIQRLFYVCLCNIMGLLCWPPSMLAGMG